MKQVFVAMIGLLLSAGHSAQSAEMDSDMQKVLANLAALHPKAIETLTPAEARKQPSPADAVAKIIKDEKLKVVPHAGLSVSNRYFADMGNLRIRFYTPENTSSESSIPVIVYFRGGGWVIADLDTYDSTPAALARKAKAKAIVVSVDYPMAPEHKFPAAHNEVVDAYNYVVKNAKAWGGDPARIAIVGESAGGNLSINTAIAARDAGGTQPVAVIAIYPVATTSMDTPSKKEQANAKPLNTAMLAWFFQHVLDNDGQKSSQRLNLVEANLKGLPPITIIAAEFDPLKSDSDMLAEKLKEAGNNTTLKIYSGVTHEFFGMDAVVAKANDAQDYAVSQLNEAFSKRATIGAPSRN